MTFELYIVIFNMDSWSVIFPNSSDLNLTAMTDGDNSSCVTFGVDEQTLLKGTPALSFNGQLHITMVMGNNNVLFDLSGPQDMCAISPLVMLIQPKASTGQVCEPFFKAPYLHSCRNAKGVGFLHQFYCDCSSDLCDDLYVCVCVSIKICSWNALSLSVKNISNSPVMFNATVLFIFPRNDD